MNIEDFLLIKYISITGYDANKSHKDSAINKCFYFFTLSYPPPSDWIIIFNQLWGHRERYESVYFPQAVVEGQTIKIYCNCSDDLQRCLDYLKMDVAQTNKKYIEFLKENPHLWKDWASNQSGEKQEIVEVLERLRF